MNYSDPTAMFINGNEQVTFEYGIDDDSVPWNIYLKYGVAIYMSAMVFARTEDRVWGILYNYIEWYKRQLTKYRSYRDGREYQVDDCLNFKERRLEVYLWGLETKAFKVERCKTSQFYKIGWAGDDTW